MMVAQGGGLLSKRRGASNLLVVRSRTKNENINKFHSKRNNKSETSFSNFFVSTHHREMSVSVYVDSFLRHFLAP